MNESDEAFLKRMEDGRDVAYSPDFSRLLSLARRGLIARDDDIFVVSVGDCRTAASTYKEISDE